MKYKIICIKSTAGGASADDVADQIQRKARIGSELIKYIVKTKITA
jgi:hypothetical protein